MTQSMHSCLYVGQVSHTRRQPFVHRFRYNVFLVYLDLAELDTVFTGHWLWSTGGPNLAWFRRSDFLGDANRPLDACVREVVLKQTGRAVSGPIRLLTNLRYFGYAINPVSFYFCFDESDNHVEAVVAEVTNTPWGESHTYVIRATARTDEPITARHLKEFHVSPFMTMDMAYHWHITHPADSLGVRIENHRDDEIVFSASLQLDRRPISHWNLIRTQVRHPFMTLRVLLAIYWQALQLWWRGAKFQPHPKTYALSDNANEFASNELQDDDQNLKELQVL